MAVQFNAALNSGVYSINVPVYEYLLENNKIIEADKSCLFYQIRHLSI